MLIYVLYSLFVLACIVLILSVLLQPGKADAGALFTSSFSSTAFGPRGTQTLLAKISIGAAAAFMLLSLLISMGVGGYRSVIGSDDAAPPPAQTAPAASPAAATEASPAEGAEGQPAATDGQPAAPAAEQPAAATSASPAASQPAVAPAR